MSALNSWGAYMLAAMALLLVLSPQLEAAGRDTREGVDLRNAEGVAAVLTSLRAGVSVSFSFGHPGGSDPIALSGRTVSTSYGGGEVTLDIAANLSAILLEPGTKYLAYIEGNSVEVVGVG